jgi:hypothetical protein
LSAASWATAPNRPDAPHTAARGAGHIRPTVALLLAFAGALLWWHVGDALAIEARISLAVFAAALVCWSVLRLDETQVAIGGALVLVGFGVVEPTTLYTALGNDLTWLLLGGFVLAAVLQASGLAERWTLQAARGAARVGALMQRLTWLIALTAFVVPSTSARAALLLPVFLVLARSVGSPAVVRALALLFPTIILLSAGASLLGAGAHLIAIDTLRRLGLPAPGFAGWRRHCRCWHALRRAGSSAACSFGPASGSKAWSGRCRTTPRCARINAGRRPSLA